MQVLSDTFNISMVVIVLVVIRQMKSSFINGYYEYYPGQSGFYRYFPLLASFLVSNSGHAVGSFPHYTDIHPSDTHRGNADSYLKSDSNFPLVGVPCDHLS